MAILTEHGIALSLMVRLMARSGRKHLQRAAYTDIRAFERQFKDGGTLIIKFHLHISKEVQHQRLEELRANQSTAWRVTDEVLLRHQRS